MYIRGMNQIRVKLYPWGSCSSLDLVSGEVFDQPVGSNLSFAPHWHFSTEGKYNRYGLTTNLVLVHKRRHRQVAVGHKSNLVVAKMSLDNYYLQQTLT